MPKFSVIIPTHNRPEFLSLAVASVLAQSFEDFELLIVNDGQTPVPDFSDPRIKVLDNDNRGAVPARNLGALFARGQFIAFLDDDDVWSARDHLSFAHFSDADFFFADGMLKFPNGNSKLFAQNADAKSLKLNNTILISAVCYKKSLHDLLGPFDEQLPYYWDWDWYLRVARSGANLQRRAAAVVDIHIHSQNMSGNSFATERQMNLDQLCAKHKLAKVALKGHVDFV